MGPSGATERLLPATEPLQSFTTTSGTTYDISFCYAAVSQGGDQTDPLTYSINGGMPTTVYIDTTGVTQAKLTPWVQEATQFTATGTSSTLSFTGHYFNQWYGTALDNVSVQQHTP